MKIHMCGDKLGILKRVQEDGHRAVFGDQFESQDECLQAILDVPTKFIPPSDCDNVTEEGRCGGHPDEPE